MMVIEKVHGLQATGMTMDQRFTLLATAAPDRVIRQKRRPIAPFFNQTLNNKNWELIEKIARQLGHQQKQNNWGGMGMGMRQQGLRRYGSESSLPGLRRANSVGNLTQQNVRSRLNWKPNYNNNTFFRNRSRSVSVSSAPGSRGPRWRNMQQRLRYRNFRGRFQANGVGGRGFRRGTGMARRGVARGGVARGGVARGGVARGGVARGAFLRNGAVRGGGQRGGGQTRGGARGRGNNTNRGGISRPQTPKPLPTREELDAQLDHYMAGTKAALDKELEDYMKDAIMDLDEVI